MPGLTAFVGPKCAILCVWFMFACYVGTYTKWCVCVYVLWILTEFKVRQLCIIVMVSGISMVRISLMIIWVGPICGCDRLGHFGEPNNMIIIISIDEMAVLNNRIHFEQHRNSCLYLKPRRWQTYTIIIIISNNYHNNSIIVHHTYSLCSNIMDLGKSAHRCNDNTKWLESYDLCAKYVCMYVCVSCTTFPRRCGSTQRALPLPLQQPYRTERTLLAYTKLARIEHHVIVLQCVLHDGVWSAGKIAFT